MLCLGTLALLVLQLATRVTAEERYYDFDIANAVVCPDGVCRSAVTVNGVIPGPLISGNSGDRFLINATDTLTDPSMRRSTSIHWHGMFHREEHSVSMDGVASVTQCPIVPGHSFLYNFSCPQQAGTYWYHSHLSTQYCDGLAGPLVIYDPEDPQRHLYDVDDESTVITLQDWIHTVTSVHTFGPPPDPDSTLINGLGRWSGNPTSDLAVVRAQGGKRHRFRLINMSCFPSYTFSIDQHNFTVIEADGVATRPVTVDKLQIYAGQRYSIVVTMDQPIDNYWIRAIPSNPVKSTSDAGINSAILRYDDAPIAEPSHHTGNDSAKEFVMLKETDLHPLINPGAPGKPYPGGADVVFTFDALLDNSTWMMNGASFKPPSAPVLLQVLSGAGNAKDLLPRGSVFEVPSNAVVEVNFIPKSVGGHSHPMHLHGHTFDVVRPAGSSVYNFKDPVRRDVFSPGGELDPVTIRFVTDNPGPWFFHCHIDWHLEHGLAVVFAEDIRDIAKEDMVNDDWKSLCPLYDQNNPDKHFDFPI